MSAHCTVLSLFSTVATLVVICVYVCRKRLCYGKWSKKKLSGQKQYELSNMRVSKGVRDSIIQLRDSMQGDSDSDALYDDENFEVIEVRNESCKYNNRSFGERNKKSAAKDSKTTSDNGECNTNDMADISAKKMVFTGLESAADVQVDRDDVGDDSISLQSHTREDVPLV